MTRTEMEPAARERLLDSMLAALAEHGHGLISLPEVLGRAGISEADFLAEYTDLDACLHAAYGQLTARIDAVVRTGCSEGGDWPARIRNGLAALLDALAADPLMARALTRAFPSIDAATQARYQAFVESFGPMLAGGREVAESDELPSEVEALAVGAAEAIVFQEIESGRAVQLPEMAPSILFSVLVPFLGAEHAAAEMERARGNS